MPRKPTPYTAEFPLHLVARSNNHDWFQIPIEDCWNIFSNELEEVRKRFGFQTHAFVLMSNHYHWLMSTPDLQLAEGMCYFQSTTSRKIGRLAKRINRIYGARYKPTVIQTAEYYAHSYRYIFQNPLRAKICDDVASYPWSTFVDRSISVSVRRDFHEMIPRKNLLEWLNQLPPEPAMKAVQSALRRRVFEFPRGKNKHQSGDLIHL